MYHNCNQSLVVSWQQLALSSPLVAFQTAGPRNDLARTPKWRVLKEGCISLKYERVSDISLLSSGYLALMKIYTSAPNNPSKKVVGFAAKHFPGEDIWDCIVEHMENVRFDFHITLCGCLIYFASVKVLL
jgi:hypothetical protein